MTKTKGVEKIDTFLLYFVGIPGFEPGTLCSQSRCANRTALHPEETLLISVCKYKGFFLYYQIFYSKK